MENNTRIYRAAWNLVYAARELEGIDDLLRKLCLDKAEELLNKIEIDEENISDIEKYKERIKE